MTKKQHIDEAQPATVTEHLRLLVEDDAKIEEKYIPVSNDDLPEWFDAKLFKRGQEYYMNNLLSLGAASLTGLVSIVAVPETLEVLIFTKQSGNPCVAFKRYAQTLLHIYKMYHNDILDPESKFYDELNVIRWKHAVSHKRAKNAGLAGIYQRDMAITQFGFMGFAVTRRRELGLCYEPEGLEGFVHFWRVVGYLLGIPDRLNICRKTMEETTELCERLMHDVIGKHMSDKKPEFLELIRHIINGMWYIDISVNTEAFIALTYNLCGLEYGEPLKWHAYLTLKYRQWLLYSCGLPYIGSINRVYYNYVLTFTYWAVEKWPIVAQLAFGKEKTRLCLYPKIK